MSNDKPWTDYERLLKLEQAVDTTREMADRLGCHPNTIRKHLERAREEVDDVPYESEEEENQPVRGPKICVRCEENETPGGADSGNSLCVDCIDEVRHGE